METVVVELQGRPKKVATGLYLDEVVLEKVKLIAEKAGISVNSALGQLVELGVKHLEQGQA